MPPRFFWTLSVLAAAVAGGCSSGDKTGATGPSRAADSGSSEQGGAGGASGGGGKPSGGSTAGGGQGTGGAITDVPCGAAICKPLPDTSVESRACCTATASCGYLLPLSTKCLGKNQPGTINPVCPAFDLAGKVSYPGCCSPTGCGALVTTGGIGCVDRTALGLPHLDCVFDTIHRGDAGGGAAGPTDASAPDAP